MAQTRVNRPSPWLARVDPRRVGPIRSLLVFVPVAAALQLAGASAGWRFLASALAIIPLAGLMGEATEHLAVRAARDTGVCPLQACREVIAFERLRRRPAIERDGALRFAPALEVLGEHDCLALTDLL